METDRDRHLAREIGRSMRLFLNLSCILVISFSVFILCAPRTVTPESLIIALIPVLAAILLFLAFLGLLKLIENNASEQKDILLTSRIIWEYNKSWVIRTTLGKIKAFIEEKDDKKKLPPGGVG